MKLIIVALISASFASAGPSRLGARQERTTVTPPNLLQERDVAAGAMPRHLLVRNPNAVAAGRRLRARAPPEEAVADLSRMTDRELVSWPPALAPGTGSEAELTNVRPSLRRGIS